MTPPNGHANSSAVPSVRGVEASTVLTPASLMRTPDGSEKFSPEEIRRYTAELEIPFDRHVIEWRVTNTSQNRARGQVIPYADQRAYTDRLNTLFTPAGWTRKYTIHTSANFERSKDQKIVAKVLVTCELTIFGLGSHSATGEEWADNDNAGTAAEAQAFKRACCCFGLGRYLYYFEGVWVDLDERKRPKFVPQLPIWATPTGWRQGLRPNDSMQSNSTTGGTKVPDGPSQAGSVVAEIEGMAEQLGRGLYRGILRDLARVWNPREIGDVSQQQKVLEHMRSAERGLRRLEAALDKTGPEALIPVLKTIGLTSIERVGNLETLKRIVLDLERAACSKH
jgi:Rad52/22 family double-strand break repair protein